MKVFIIAFACEPNRTSEPGVGWNVAREMASRHDVTVITRANNRDVIESVGGIKNVKWIYFDLAGWFCKLKKRIPYGSQIYQELWNKAVARRFRKEIEASDIVHQLTFGAAFFTPWAARYAKNFVWGPLGGGDKPIPFSFMRRMDSLSLVREFTYGFVSRVACRGTLLSRSLRSKVDAIIFRTREFSKRMKCREEVDISIVGETAYTEPIVPREYDMSQRPLRVMIVGRLIPHKAADFALQAFARFVADGGDGELTVCGSGPLEAKMRRIAQKAQLGTKVRFLGQVDHEKVIEELKRSDVLLHLSFREGGSWSILEAMAYGLPVICQRASGMDDMVADDCGGKIVADTPEALVNAAAQKLMEYYDDSELIRRHGTAAQKRVEQVYRWKNITDKIDFVYARVVGRNDE